MKKRKYEKQRKQGKGRWLWILVILLVAAIAAVLLVTQLWEGIPDDADTRPAETQKATEASSATDPTNATDAIASTDNGIENNPFLADMSMSGMITLVEDMPCFVSNQLYTVELDGQMYPDVNCFYLEDEVVLNHAEQNVILRAAGIKRQDEHFIIDIQYFVAEDVCIPTPFAMLHFPGEWVDNLYVRRSFDSQCYRVEFSAVVNEEKVLLFTVHFGETELEPVGKLTDSQGGVMMVYIQVADTDLIQFADEQQTWLYAMAESVNYLLAALEENTAFSTEY